MAKESAQERQRGHAEGARKKLAALRAHLAEQRTPLEAVAEKLTRLASSTGFLAFHALWFGGWIGWNVLGAKAFDPFPFGLLTMIVSLEAIFLAIFVLMTQTRDTRLAELREQMTLQVDMRTEEEVTKTLELVAALCRRAGIPVDQDEELREMLIPLDPEAMERELEEEIEGERSSPRKR